jgi:hypothetical protein
VNTLTYYGAEYSTAVKRFIMKAVGGSTMKLFTNTLNHSAKKDFCAAQFITAIKVCSIGLSFFALRKHYLKSFKTLRLVDLN